jgi:hypothetical protein
MDLSNRITVRMPKIKIAAKVWKIQLKIQQEFSRQGDKPVKETVKMNIFQVLN